MQDWKKIFCSDDVIGVDPPRRKANSTREFWRIREAEKFSRGVRAGGWGLAHPPDHHAGHAIDLSRRWSAATRRECRPLYWQSEQVRRAVPVRGPQRRTGAFNRRGRRRQRHTPDGLFRLVDAAIVQTGPMKSPADRWLPVLMGRATRSHRPPESPPRGTWERRLRCSSHLSGSPSIGRGGGKPAKVRE